LKDGGNGRKEKVILHIPKNSEVQIRRNCFVINIHLKEGETKEFILENCTKRGDYRHKDLEKKTRTFWTKWVSKGTFFEFCREKLIRSAITLKLMQFYKNRGPYFCSNNFASRINSWK